MGKNADAQSPDAPVDKPIGKLTIAEFARSGRVVRIHSTVLGCEFVHAADNADPAKVGPRGVPVYWAREFKHLRDVGAEELRLIHHVKVEFDGELVDQ